MKISKLVLLAIMFSLLSACASSRNFEALDASARSYERAIRWAEFVRAKSFHKKDPTLSDFERHRLKAYRVTHYSVLRSETPNETNSYATVEVKYYKNDRPTVKSLSVKQHWKRDKNSKLWYLDSSFPLFR